MPAEITTDDVDQLLAYLPWLTTPGRQFVSSWNASVQREDGVWSMPWPNYTPDVVAFFRQAAAECWLDYNYKPEEAGAMLSDPARVASASLEEIKTMLTHCVRGERFCDGFWETVLENGKVVALLGRLKALRDGGERPAHAGATDG
ncbi:MAG: DUF6508 domain-containing protein [Candidatus Promineifilaceae bacterium]